MIHKDALVTLKINIWTVLKRFICGHSNTHTHTYSQACVSLFSSIKLTTAERSNLGQWGGSYHHHFSLFCHLVVAFCDYTICHHMTLPPHAVTIVSLSGQISKCMPSDYIHELFRSCALVYFWGPIWDTLCEYISGGSMNTRGSWLGW